MVNRKRKQARCGKCGAQLGDLVCSNCVMKELKTMPPDQAKATLMRAGTQLRRELEKLRQKWREIAKAGVKVS
jgi:hypothetical protein